MIRIAFIATLTALSTPATGEVVSYADCIKRLSQAIEWEEKAHLFFLGVSAELDQERMAGASKAMGQEQMREFDSQRAAMDEAQDRMIALLADTCEAKR